LPIAAKFDNTVLSRMKSGIGDILFQLIDG